MSLSARTVEVRGRSGTISAISPKWSCGPSRRTSRPPTSTVACPSRITKNATPPLPWVTISLPGGTSRSATVRARLSSALRGTGDRNGTFWSASSVTDMTADATSSAARDARNQVTALAHHPRARNDEVEPGRQRALAHLGLGVREHAEQRGRLAGDLRGLDLHHVDDEHLGI